MASREIIEERGRGDRAPVRSLLPATQVFGFCFYWAWVYLSFNASASVNPVLSTHLNLVYVHLASMIAGVALYGVVIAFSRRSRRLFERRAQLAVAGALMAAGTACYAFGDCAPLPLMLVGAVVSGVASVWLVIFWGRLFSTLSARNIVFATAASFGFAHVIYYAGLLMPEAATGAVTTALPLLAALLYPEPQKICRYLGPIEADGEGADGAVASQSQRASRFSLMPLSGLPWRVALGLAAVMFVYGGARVYVASFDRSGVFGFEWTAGLTIAVVAAFVVWGALFQGENASLGTAYKITLPLLGSALLMVAIFGHEYVALIAPLMTGIQVVIEILSWILLADIARTTRTPAFLVFAIGRLAVQGGMFAGQLSAWLLVDMVAPFAVAGIFALMLVTGFMFDSQDTLLVFEAPSKVERERAERRLGRSMGDHLEEMAEIYGLTQREKEIFSLWVTGHGSKYIQESLVISSSTVKTHVRHIYEKCGVHSRAEIMRLLEMGS